MIYLFNLGNVNMKVYKAINQVADVMSKKGISKENKNQQQGYKFRGIDDVYNALAPALVNAGLVILPRCLEREVSERTTSKGGVLFYTTLKVDFDFVSVDDGSKHTITTYGEAMDSADKSTNKAMSAAYKYACFQAFCIPTDGDNDADSTTHEVAPRLRDSDYKAFEQTDFSDLGLLQSAYSALLKRCQTKDEQARIIAIKDKHKSKLNQ